MAGEGGQRPVVALLSRADTYGPRVESVERITTHISHLFLAGEHAYKLKRAVRRPYLDFSTLDARKTACERELELNRRAAPDLYEKILAVTRSTDGALALEGQGATVDWLVVMRRFDQDCLFDRLACRGGLTPEILRALGDSIAEFHARAEPRKGFGGASAIRKIIAGNARAFADCPGEIFQTAAIDRLQRSCNDRLNAVAGLLDRRRDDGKVRVCHGDLHLRNICLIEGRPVLFDCVEFSDELITIDVLYDLSFVLMDLLHRGLKTDANLVLNRYLDRSDETGGLAALPLFMALRAAIRAHVTASTGNSTADRAEAQDYLDLSRKLLAPASPRLVAVGGLSGTGKSTLAYRLAPSCGLAPGARVLRSDVVRKRLFGVAPETRLGPDGYEQGVTERVYRALATEAAAVLAAGQAVIVDAVFARPDERAAIRAVATNAGLPFTGLWLEGPTATLERRVAGRRGDASDADLTVVQQQAGYDAGQLDWRRIDASGPIDDVATEAERNIG